MGSTERNEGATMLNIPLDGDMSEGVNNELE